MRVLGIVEWRNRDKAGYPVAGVRPLLEIQDGPWREIEAVEEFPSQGQVFWPSAHSAVDGMLISFRAEPNPGQKDEYKVVDARHASEVLDLARYGCVTDVRHALAAGVRLPGPAGAIRALVLCGGETLVGPVDLTRAAGVVKLSGTNLARLGSFKGGELQSVRLSGIDRLVRVDDGPAVAYVDWDDDATIIRRALETAVRLAKQAGRDTGQTKKQIEEAAKSFASERVGLDGTLERYRVERALALAEETEAVVRGAPELVALLCEHPALKETLDDLGAKARLEAEQTIRADLEKRLIVERAALEEAQAARERIIAEFEERIRARHALENEIGQLRSQAATAAKDAETAIEASVRAAIDRPWELLANVSVLRPLIGRRKESEAPTGDDAPPRLHWSQPRGESIKDRAAMRTALTRAARFRGVDPALMIQLHAAVVAGVMPVVLGPCSLAMLSAYAYALCGSRFVILHVSPGVIRPRDLTVTEDGGLLAAAAAAGEVDGLSLAVLEGANRSPIEAAVLPLLQLQELGLTPLVAARGFRLAATFVTGVTTVPVSSQVWNHAVALYPQAKTVTADAGERPGDISLASDLLALGTVPTAEIDELLDAWPVARELRPILERFGAALDRIYDAPRIADALLHGVILPFVVTTLSVEEQESALAEMEDSDDALTDSLRRLRKNLC